LEQERLAARLRHAADEIAERPRRGLAEPLAPRLRHCLADAKRGRGILPGSSRRRREQIAEAEIGAGFPQPIDTGGGDIVVALDLRLQAAALSRVARGEQA